MLIECRYCGAPLDVTPAQRSAKCRYCGSSSLIGEARTVAPATPPAWKPPPQWTPPAHVAADSSKPLRYRPEYWIHQIAGLLVTLAVAGVMATVAAVALISEFRSKPVTASRPTHSESVANSQRSAADTGLFEAKALGKLVSRYEKKLGIPVRAVELTIHREHAALVACAPDNPEHLNRYSYRGGEVEAGKPVKRAGFRGADDPSVFQLGDLPLERLPGFVSQAVEKLGYEKAKATHIIIDKRAGSARDVTVRVYVSNQRESGRVEFSGQGELKRVFR
jgi:DNA-directed RNA polymerase subunit RPC12/RpoP